MSTKAILHGMKLTKRLQLLPNSKEAFICRQA
jgi:hypothetical protein